MRTVTFSDATVAAALNEKFICTWVNREPGFHNCDLTAERRISATDCFATKNFCTFFTTPELEVLHYASGFFGPRMFMDELTVVFELKKATLDLKNRFMLDALPEYRKVHELHAREHLELIDRLTAAENPDRKKQRHPDEKKKHYVEGIRHLAAVHRSLNVRAGADVPVALDSVFRDYLFGNGFEESRGSDRDRRPDRSPGM